MMQEKFRKPKGPSEPIEKRNPSTISEPTNQRNPRSVSEPHEFRKPLRRSEPSQGRKPGDASEPVKKRNPLIFSEPGTGSNPRLESGCLFDGGSLEKREIRALVEIYYDVQDVRISSFSRLRQVGEVEGVHPEHLKKLEGEIKKYIETKLNSMPIYIDFLSGIKGVGPIIAGGLIGQLDPYKAKHISSFWKYMGLHVEDGKAPKRRRGSKLSYNPKAKVLAWKISESFIKQRTPVYREIYDEAKIRENEKLGNPIEDPKNCPHYKECVGMLRSKAERLGRKAKKPPCKKHIDYRARRKMVKRFLSDLWVEWRRLEGLPVTPPYAHRTNDGAGRSNDQKNMEDEDEQDKD